MSNEARAPFDRVLKKFKADLDQDEIEDFGSTTAANLKNTIKQLQDKQALEVPMESLHRLDSFMEATDQYDKVLQDLLGATDHLSFIWGPAKSMLLMASSNPYALNALLDAYRYIGENIPLLQSYRSIQVNILSLQPVLCSLYEDVLEFHRQAMHCFRQRAWEKIFHANWETLRASIKNIVQQLQSQQRLLNSQLNQNGDLQVSLAIMEFQYARRILQDKFECSQGEKSREQKRKVLVWLSAADSVTDHDTLASHERLPDSGKWLFQQELIKNWVNIHALIEPCLWINGKHGVGKTILASMLVEECRRQPDSSVAFFYCKRRDPTRDNFIAFAQSIILQLSQLRPSLLPFLHEKASVSNTELLNSPTVAKEILNVGLSCFKNLYLIIDGMNDCARPQKEKILASIQSAILNSQAEASERVRCCFLSRDDDETRSLLETLPTFRITKKHNSGDILSYCQYSTKSIADIFELSPKERKVLSGSISEKANGSFLYATEMIEKLLSLVSRAELNREIEK